MILASSTGPGTAIAASRGTRHQAKWAEDHVNRAAPTDLLLVRHVVKINGQVVYAGEDFTKALRLHILHAQSLDLIRIDYIVQKQAVPVYHDPSAIAWDEV